MSTILGRSRCRCRSTATRSMSTGETTKQITAPLCVLPASVVGSQTCSSAQNPAHIHQRRAAAQQTPLTVTDLCKAGRYEQASLQLSQLRSHDADDPGVVLAYMQGIGAFAEAGLTDLAVKHLSQALSAKLCVGLPVCRSIMRTALQHTADSNNSGSHSHATGLGHMLSVLTYVDMIGMRPSADMLCYALIQAVRAWDLDKATYLVQMMSDHELPPPIHLHTEIIDTLKQGVLRTMPKPSRYMRCPDGYLANRRRAQRYSRRTHWREPGFTSGRSPEELALLQSLYQRLRTVLAMPYEYERAEVQAGLQLWEMAKDRLDAARVMSKYLGIPLSELAFMRGQDTGALIAFLSISLHAFRVDKALLSPIIHSYVISRRSMVVLPKFMCSIARIAANVQPTSQWSSIVHDAYTNRRPDGHLLGSRRISP